MPQDKPPLTPAEIELITPVDRPGGRRRHARRTPRPAYDMDHPPVYTRPPVITALDFSPDGKLLAVAGFHEVLLWKADGSELVARLVGLSERIESVALLARRQAAGRHRRPARPDGRGPGLGRRQAEARALGPRHLRHGLRRELVARRHEDRLRLRRQHASGPSTPRPASRSCSWARTTTGCSTRSSRPTART